MQTLIDNLMKRQHEAGRFKVSLQSSIDAILRDALASSSLAEKYSLKLVSDLDQESSLSWQIIAVLFRLGKFAFERSQHSRKWRIKLTTALLG